MIIPPKAIVIGIGLVLFGILEQLMPFFDPSNSRNQFNWRLNFSLGLLNTIISSTTIILVLKFGWENSTIAGLKLFPEPIALIAAFLILDVYLYLWHRLMHSRGWAIHRLHHTDRHLNISTAYRFNPIEVILSQVLRIPIILLFAITPLQLLIYEIFFSLSLLFHHSNWYLSQSIDRILSKFIVTPNLHRLHHSQSIDSYANFSSILTLWDILGGTFRYPKQPRKLRLGTRL